MRRIRWDCPPWRGQGRYLDVGCGSGGALGVAQALGWQVTGVEVDEAAAEKAGASPREIHVGDVLAAPFAAGRFDVVTAFHVLEHVPDPVAVLRRMLAVAGARRAAHRRGAECRRPRRRDLRPGVVGARAAAASLALLARRRSGARSEQAGGRVAWCWHGAKPRYYLWSLAASGCATVGGSRLARFTEWRPVYGVLKLLLEVTLPLATMAEAR